MTSYIVSRLANRPGIPGIVPEIVLLSWRPGNLPMSRDRLPTGFVPMAYLPGVYWRLALILSRRLFSHVQISSALVLHLTLIALVHMESLGSDYYKRLHGHQTGVSRRQVHTCTTCTRASATRKLHHAAHLRA